MEEYNKIGNYNKVIDERRSNDNLRKALKAFVIKHKWGDEMRGNNVEVLSKELKLEINDELFYNLYPNEVAPSDHPAFIFTVSLNQTSLESFGGSKSNKSTKLSKKSAKKSGGKTSKKKSTKKSAKLSKKSTKKKKH